MSLKQSHFPSVQSEASGRLRSGQKHPAPGPGLPRTGAPSLQPGPWGWLWFCRSSSSHSHGPLSTPQPPWGRGLSPTRTTRQSCPCTGAWHRVPWAEVLTVKNNHRTQRGKHRPAERSGNHPPPCTRSHPQKPRCRFSRGTGHGNDRAGAVFPALPKGKPDFLESELPDAPATTMAELHVLRYPPHRRGSPGTLGLAGEPFPRGEGWASSQGSLGALP